MAVIDLAQYEYTLTLNSSDYKKGMKEVEQSAEGMKGKLSGIGSTLKTSLAVGITAVTAAAGAAATMLSKEVISAYADFEQLVGGVDTLFGEASQTVQGYAENAFRTAGMTANDYMETVTGFSASLIQSLDGDTAKAAQVADMAITDMSDNANKMGSSMESIQNAYQGFAKQNYTMLDNLKLGYGGTKEEMERLLSDAGKISGIEYDISSFSDVSEAIHVVQTEMGITGTTALESALTIEGSMASMQSAIGNLMAGLGNSDADIGALINNIVDSFQDVVKNIMPVIDNIVAALPSALDGILQAVGDILPPLLDTVSELFGQVLTMILSLLPELIPAAVDAVMVIVGALIDNLPLLITAAVQLVTSLVEGIVSALPELIPAAIDAVLTIADTLIDNIDLLIDGAIALIIGLAEGLINALPQLIERVPEIIIKLTDAIINNAGKLAKAAVQLIVTLAKGIVENIPVLIAELPKIISAVFNALTVGFRTVLSIGKGIVEGIYEGISASWTWLTTKLKEWCGNILSAIKGWFGIHSPSRVMRDEVGKPLVEGIAVGIKENSWQVSEEFKKLLDDLDLLRDTGVIDEAEYYKRLEWLRNGYLEKGTKEWWDYTKKIISYENKMLKEMESNSKEQLKVVQENKAKIMETYKALAEETLGKYDEIMKAQDAFADKLKGYGKLYDTTTITIKDGDNTETFEKHSLRDISQDIKELEEYQELLEGVRSRGVSSDFFNVMKDMSLEEGSQFAGILLGASDEEFNKYIADWQRKQETAKSISEGFFKDEVDSLEKEFLNELGNTMSGLTEEYSEYGAQYAMAIGTGFINTISSVMSRIGESMSFNAPIPSMAFAGGTLFRQGERAFAGSGIVERNTNNTTHSTTSNDINMYGDFVLPNVQKPKDFMRELKSLSIMRNGNGFRKNR